MRSIALLSLAVLCGCRLDAAGLTGVLTTSDADGQEVLADATMIDTFSVDSFAVDAVQIDGETAEASAPSCADGLRDGDETDVDCGGSTCPRCKVGTTCASPSDCESRVCAANTCAAPSCSDGVRNADETDIDCGGPKCLPCTVNGSCARNADCETLICGAKGCVYPSTCRELHEKAPLLPSAVYFVDPDQAGARAALQTYCDMTTDGGGWTFFAHFDGASLPPTFLESDVGTFLPSRLDDGKTWSIAGTLLPFADFKAVMLSLDTPEPGAAAPLNKLLVLAPGAGSTAFRVGPFPCADLSKGYAYRTSLTGAFTDGGGTNGCDATRWYLTTVASGTSYLAAMHLTDTGLYWGGGMKGDGLYGHDGWWFVR